jgi:hypothetical protein
LDSVDQVHDGENNRAERQEAKRPSLPQLLGKKDCGVQGVWTAVAVDADEQQGRTRRKRRGGKTKKHAVPGWREGQSESK